MKSEEATMFILAIAIVFEYRKTAANQFCRNRSRGRLFIKKMPYLARNSWGMRTTSI